MNWIKNIIIGCVLYISSIGNVNSAVIFITSGGEQENYIQITPKGDTMYVYDKEIVSKDYYNLKIKEEKKSEELVIYYMISFAVWLGITFLGITILLEFLIESYEIYNKIILILIVLITIVWPIICGLTSLNYLFFL
jgi:hypothetical protein